MIDLSKIRSMGKNPNEEFGANESGSTLVEFAVVLPIFLLILFGIIDFGRMAYNFVTAEKAMHIAARVAAVRPAACPNVPLVNARGPVAGGTIPPKYGSNCNVSSTTCDNPGVISCTGLSGDQTASEIWSIVSGALPSDATIANLKISYTFDDQLGFLGGPYTPIVTVELQNLDFKFVSPLSVFVGMAGGTASPGLGADIPFPAMSVSLPAEDLAMGDAG